MSHPCLDGQSKVAIHIPVGTKVRIQVAWPSQGQCEAISMSRPWQSGTRGSLPSILGKRSEHRAQRVGLNVRALPW